MAASRPRAWIAWSSGKDGAWALHVARQGGEFDVVGMLTTLTRDYERVSMHAVREELVEAQAEAAGLPLHKAQIPAECTDETYQDVMREAMEAAKVDGVTHVIFGDLFLEDVRKYRETQLAKAGMTAVFPLWGLDTARLARQMIDDRVRACITCLDPRKMPRELAGSAFDEEFLAALPEGVDPCGENGEFHTFVHDAPVFSNPISVRVGETVERNGFVFTDVVPA